MMNDAVLKKLFLEAEKNYLNNDNLAAKNILFSILRAAPTDSKANELLGSIYFDENNIRKAIDCLKITAEDTNCSAAVLYKLASSYSQLENYPASIECLMRLHEKIPQSIEIITELASLHVMTNEYRGVLRWLHTANKISPNSKEILYNIGRAYDELLDTTNAIAFYEQSLNCDAQFVEPLYNLGTIFAAQKKYKLALDYFIKVYEINSDQEYLLGDIIFSLKNLCSWSMESEYLEKLNQAEQLNRNLVKPFQYLSIEDAPERQLKIAQNFSHHKFQLKVSNPLRGFRSNNQRIKIAYVSSDFRTHASAFLTTQLFEFHDTSRFELFAFSLFPLNESDPWTSRLRVAFENFIDVSSMSDDQIVEAIRNFEIDIAIDLMGHTALSRTMIFAKRIAPIQINFLGYPGTMGSEFIDYIVADEHLIPSQFRKYYSENIIYMPDTFQPNDDNKPASKKVFSKNELGLPEHSFIFCCFNSTYKINKVIFSTWVEILKATSNSVLWLSSGDPEVQINLSFFAKNMGLDPGRLVFSNPMPYEDYLECYKFANLFLDTVPFNGGTTARDAIWSGIPVLTLEGKSFSGRMASSLLRSIGMYSLIAKNLDEYKQVAIKLARNEDLYKITKDNFAHKKDEPSFGVRSYVKNLEIAYEKLFEMVRNKDNFRDLFIPRKGS